MPPIALRAASLRRRSGSNLHHLGGGVRKGRGTILGSDRSRSGLGADIVVGHCTCFAAKQAIKGPPLAGDTADATVRRETRAASKRLNRFAPGLCRGIVTSSRPSHSN